MMRGLYGAVSGRRKLDETMRRITVSGTTGTGKSTLARRIAAALEVPFIELDALHWEPNWHPLDPADFRRRVDEATAGTAWVVAGNYSAVKDLTWGRADTIVWLDYPFLTTGVRLLRRTIRRVATREVLWGTNRESFGKAFLSRDSIFLWFFRTHRRRREAYPRELAPYRAGGVAVVVLRRQAATDAWLAQLTQTD
jgi:adenylate kinase family enzyme